MLLVSVLCPQRKRCQSQEFPNVTKVREQTKYKELVFDEAEFRLVWMRETSFTE